MTVSAIGSAFAPADRATVIAAAMTTLGDAAEMHGLNYEREDMSGPETEARAKAWAAIIAKATELARLAGLTVGRPVSIIESAGSQILPFGLKMSDIDLASPVEPGRKAVHVHLVVRFALTE